MLNRIFRRAFKSKVFGRSHNVYFISVAHIFMLSIYKFKIFKQEAKCPKTGTPPFSRGKRRRFWLLIINYLLLVLV